MRGPPRAVRSLVAAGCLLAAAFSANASDTPLLPDEESALIVAITGDRVTFTWLAKEGRTYVIMVADRASSSSRWREIPGLDPVRGRGERVTLRHTLRDAQQYRYTLRTFLPPSESRRWWRRPSRDAR